MNLPGVALLQIMLLTRRHSSDGSTATAAKAFTEACRLDMSNAAGIPFGLRV
jgi:hypothetical protein